MGLCVFYVCMILLEPVGLDSRNVAHAWPAGARALLSLGQGLTILFTFSSFMAISSASYYYL